jgi:hypothetical protein
MIFLDFQYVLKLDIIKQAYPLQPFVGDPIQYQHVSEQGLSMAKEKLMQM